MKGEAARKINTPHDEEINPISLYIEAPPFPRPVGRGSSIRGVMFIGYTIETLRSYR
jgi:hypothetical protein